MHEAIKQIAAHPLCPITASEIQRSAELIKRSWPNKTVLHFKTITLEEPAKSDLVPYLEAEHKGSRLPRIDRRAFVSYYIRNTVSEQETLCSIRSIWKIFIFLAGQITRSHNQPDQAKSRE